MTPDIEHVTAPDYGRRVGEIKAHKERYTDLLTDLGNYLTRVYNIADKDLKSKGVYINKTELVLVFDRSNLPGDPRQYAHPCWHLKNESNRLDNADIAVAFGGKNFSKCFAVRAEPGQLKIEWQEGVYTPYTRLKIASVDTDSEQRKTLGLKPVGEEKRILCGYLFSGGEKSISEKIRQVVEEVDSSLDGRLELLTVLIQAVANASGEEIGGIKPLRGSGDIVPPVDPNFNI